MISNPKTRQQWWGGLFLILHFTARHSNKQPSAGAVE